MNLLEHGILEGGTLCEFTSERMRISTVLQRRAHADRLTVAMNAYRGSKTWKAPPTFMGWPPTGPVLGHVLRVSDPSFFLHSGVEDGAFLGTEADDPIPPIVTYVKSLAHELGIAPERIIYFGHSGGGFGALRCALHDGQAIGLGINPTLEISAYAHLPFANNYAGFFRPGAGMLDLSRQYPHRFSIIAATQQALATGKSPTLAFIQNHTDYSHYRFHLRPFCRQFEIPATGGSDPRNQFRAVLFDKKGGHGALPDMPLVEATIEWLLDRKGQATNTPASSYR